ncbi:MAG: T9SS type A sorting domain-containing protein [Bacteroidia bacterium]
MSKTIKYKFIAALGLILYIFNTALIAQDSMLIYDVATATQTFFPLPIYNNNIASDSTNPFLGSYGVTDMPNTPPLLTYPNTQISLLQKASDYYTSFNFPFTAVTLVRYGVNITAPIIGKRALLVFNWDVYNPNPAGWRNLSDTNPFFVDGEIQNGYSKLTPVRYYVRNSPIPSTSLAVIEVAEDIGSNSGYFGLAYDTTANAYDSLLLYNLSYPNENGYPNHYTHPVNGDTLCLKYGYVNGSNPSFSAYWGGDGEYVSPFFDKNYRIHALRWNYNSNIKIRRSDFYFVKNVMDSLLTGTNEIKATNWKVYPNPAVDNLTIELPNVSNDATIEIKNLLGEILYSEKFVASSNKIINTSEFPKGVYFIQILNEQKLLIEKFIKQ